jgi:hypothetical protein
MRSGLSFDHIFPIRNDASARLMRLKADCLFDAGVISAEDRRTVYACSRAVLGFAHQDAPARADLRSDAQAAALMH